MAVLDPEHTLDLGNTESSTICYHASYHMLLCIVPFAIMQNTICYYAKYHLLSCRISFAIMQITICYHAEYHMLSRGVQMFYHNHYQPPSLTYYQQVIIIASSGALPSEFQELITQPYEFELARPDFLMTGIIIP